MKKFYYKKIFTEGSYDIINLEDRIFKFLEKNNFEYITVFERKTKGIGHTIIAKDLKDLWGTGKLYEMHHSPIVVVTEKIRNEHFVSFFANIPSKKDWLLLPTSLGSLIDNTINLDKKIINFIESI